MCFFGNIGNDTYRKLRSLNVISYLASSTGKSDTASKLTELVVKLLFLLSTLSPSVIFPFHSDASLAACPTLSPFNLAHPYFDVGTIFESLLL